MKSILKFRNERTDQILLEYGREILCSIKNNRAATPREILESKTVNPLILIGDILFDEYLSLLESRSWKMKYLAIHVLGRLGDNRAVEHLARLLGENDTSLHSACVEALCSIDETRAAESLLLHFRGKQIPDDVIRYFGKIGFHFGISVLIEQIKAPYSTYTIALIEETLRKILETSLSEIDSQDLLHILGLQDNYSIEYKYGGKLDSGYHPGSEDFGQYETWEEVHVINFVPVKNTAARELDRRGRM